ncbi:hypothetical protein K7432_017542 [Basidiobolus ranarum]|uniref:Uncharacterized protein n=1 Tax=Basidiobolus ranarum TaxID=34480 RepID=A0ABR2VK81_9FUNG
MSGRNNQYYSGTNSQGHHYCHRGDSTAPGGNYHYSNSDGSYYYQNANGSTYYASPNTGTAWYSPPSGGSSGSSDKSYSQSNNQ